MREREIRLFYAGLQQFIPSDLRMQENRDIWLFYRDRPFHELFDRVREQVPQPPFSLAQHVAFLGMIDDLIDAGEL